MQLINTTVPTFTLFLRNGKRHYCKYRWQIAPWRPMILCVAWIMLANLLLPTTRNKKQPRDEIPKLDFAKHVATRVSKTFGQVSTFSTAQIPPQMCHASRASRPQLTGGIPRVLCHGMWTAQRFHIDGEGQRCKAGCQDEPDSFSHYNKCPLLCNFFA